MNNFYNPNNYYNNAYMQSRSIDVPAQQPQYNPLPNFNYIFPPLPQQQSTQPAINQQQQLPNNIQQPRPLDNTPTFNPQPLLDKILLLEGTVAALQQSVASLQQYTTTLQQSVTKLEKEWGVVADESATNGPTV